MLRLREATRLAHSRVEAFLPLLDPSLTIATYIRVLEAFHGFYEPLEPLVAAVLAVNPCAGQLAPGRGKVPLLLADLLVLGKTHADVQALPRCTDLPHVASASHAVGVLYVVEGATLGGQVITRHLRETFGARVSGGTTFFSAYGDRTGSMWKAFSRHVDASTCLDTDAARGAALQTFEKLSGWFERELGPA